VSLTYAQCDRGPAGAEFTPFAPYAAEGDTVVVMTLIDERELARRAESVDHQGLSFLDSTTCL
jgi:hypothetical protein